MDGIITEEMKERFRASFLFAGLPRLEPKLEAEIFAKAEFFSKGKCVYESSRFRNALGIIVSGTVRITTTEEENRVILRDMCAGETFGAAALFGAAECYVSEIRATSACTVVFLEEEALKKLFEKYPQAAQNYITFLSSKIRYLNRKIAELSMHGAAARVFDYMKKNAGTGGEVCMPKNMSALAGTLGIGRSSLYRALEKLEMGGYISKNGSKWNIIEGEQSQ